MYWKAGQRLVCDRPEQCLTGCLVVFADADTVKISCPAVGLVVFGHQHRLEEMGWRQAEVAEVNRE